MIPVEYLLNQVEFDFYKYKIKKNIIPVDSADGLIHKNLDIRTKACVLDFIKQKEQDIFRNIGLEEIIDQKEEIKRFIDNIEIKIHNLKQIIDVYAGWHRSNQVQLCFYHFLFESLSSILEERHYAFRNTKAFLNEPKIIEDRFIPEEAKTLENLYDLRPLISLKSPQSLISGFDILATKGVCEISSVPDFVYHCFEFSAQYQIPAASFFYFRWCDKMHVFSDLIGRLKRKRSIRATYPECVDWLSLLLGSNSKESILKYCSGQKEIIEKNRIDPQVFTLQN